MFAIISLKPKYAEAILTGQKKCEFRKVLFSRKVHILIIYATRPVGRLVGWASIEGMETGSPREIWDRTWRDAGITHDEFNNYYKGSSRAICIHIRNVHRFERPIDPRENGGGFTIPQSYRYLTDGDREFLSTHIPCGFESDDDPILASIDPYCLIE